MIERTFTTEPLTTILAHVQARLEAGDRELALVVTDPAQGVGRFAGEAIEVDGEARVHRPMRVWAELADRLRLRLLALDRLPGGWLRLTLARLDEAARVDGDPGTEKYGAESSYARISKLDDPGFVLDVADALARAKLAADARVLDLGCNRGDLFALIADLRPDLGAQGSFVGVDHSESALALARAGAGPGRRRYVCADLAELPTLELGRFDLVTCIGTMQSPGVDDRKLLEHVVRERLAPGGSLIIGVPNCCYVDGELLHGARTRNFTQPELGLLIKHVAYYKRYLQQHNRRVFVTGRNYVLVTATPYAQASGTKTAPGGASASGHSVSSS